MFFIVRTILFAAVQTCTTYIIIITTITTRLLFLSAYNLFANHICSLYFSPNHSLDLHNGDLKTNTVLFTHNFIQGWLNSYYSLCLFCLALLVQHNQYNELSWSRTFFLSLFLFVYNVHSCRVHLSFLMLNDIRSFPFT